MPAALRILVLLSGSILGADSLSRAICVLMAALRNIAANPLAPLFFILAFSVTFLIWAVMERAYFCGNDAVLE